MKAIHKYLLTDTDAKISTYERARVLHAAEQHGQVTIWAEVNTLERECLREVRTVFTGGEPPAGFDYVGTVLLHGGGLVVHVYVAQEQLR